MLDKRPLGLFDSGVGGLSVMKEVRRLLPSENLFYFADSAFCPYGNKPFEVIRARAFAIVDFLLSMNAKLIIIASNTTSIAALDAVREQYEVPVVGVEPAIKPAVAATRSGKIGVLATEVTLAGSRFNSLVERFGDKVEVYNQPCAGLVEMVESGAWNKPQAQELLARCIRPLLAKGVDTIILGCTHYPFLRSLIEKQAGAGVEVIDTGGAVARQVVRVIGKNGLATCETAPGQEYFFTSGNPAEVEPVLRLLWKDPDLIVEKRML